MSLQQNFESILDNIPNSFSQFSKDLDPEFIEKALSNSGVMTIRRRKLPPSIGIWLIIAMGLLRDRSIKEIVHHLGLLFKPTNKGKQSSLENTSLKVIAPSAIPHCREKLGSEPLALLFKLTAKSWASIASESNKWRGLSLYGIDGTTHRVPDTKVNRNEFGKPYSRRGDSGYPLVRQVTLMTLRTHIIIGSSMGRYRGKGQGEQSLAQELWPTIPDNSITIMDKGFINFHQLHRLKNNGSQRHWLIAAKGKITGELREGLGIGDAIMEVKINSQARKMDPSLPRTMLVRVLSYRTTDGKTRYLFTSLLDPEKYPADELIELYHLRWEMEIGYDDIKTHMLCREEALRSKKPEGIKQELWGVIIAYNLVRIQMLRVAETLKIPPLRISFTHSLRLIQVFCVVHAWMTPPSKIPARIDELTEMASLFVLPERDSDRRNKRHVKIKMSKYPRNVGNPR